MSVITISRQFGAGGKTLGEMVAGELGYACYDDQIIQMIAANAKVSPDWVKSVENEAGGTLMKFISSVGRKSFVDRISGSPSGYIDEEIYVDLLHKIVWQIADQGRVIILGRGGQYILRDHADAHHILLVADRVHRIRFMEKHYRFSTNQAERVVDRQDKRRAILYRKFGREDYDQPGLYHLVLNMSKMDLAEASRHICLLARPDIP
jgi:cytidylate kinase